jgi:hypothetical protein
MARRDIACLSPHSIDLLPKKQKRELEAQINKIRHLNALAEVSSSEQAAALRNFATALGDAIDEVEQRVAPLDRLTPSQQQELESQIDLVLDHNRQLLDEAQRYAMQIINDAANRPSKAERSAKERFLIGLTGSEKNYNELRKAFGG